MGSTSQSTGVPLQSTQAPRELQQARPRARGAKRLFRGRRKTHGGASRIDASDPLEGCCAALQTGLLNCTKAGKTGVVAGSTAHLFHREKYSGPWHACEMSMRDGGRTRLPGRQRHGAHSLTCCRNKGRSRRAAQTQWSSAVWLYTPCTPAAQ